MSARMLRTVISVKLGDVLEDDGHAGPKAETVAWSVLAAIPPGWHVRLELGAARWCSEHLLNLLQEHLHDAAGVQVEGERPLALQAVEKRLRADQW